MIVLSNRRPTIIALCGPNGAGKTTFYHAYLQQSGLRLINADILAEELGMNAATAANAATVLRQRLFEQRESFVFETVFSDPVGDKLRFLLEAVTAGYQVVVCFIGLASPVTSEQRVAMRASQGGHDVPSEKLITRFPRTLANLKRAIRELPDVVIFDNEDLAHPFRHVATFKNRQPRFIVPSPPSWLTPLL